MMVGLMGTSIWSGMRISKTGRYRIFPIVGTVVTAGAVAVFGAIFTNSLSEELTSVFAGAGATADQAGEATSTLTPSVLATLPETLQEGVVTAYADSLARCSGISSRSW